MSWKEVDARPDALPDEKQMILRREAMQALEASPVLTEFLRNALHATSYRPGKNIEDIAYAEGQRSVARTLLTLGGKIND